MVCLTRETARETPYQSTTRRVHGMVEKVLSVLIDGRSIEIVLRQKAYDDFYVGGIYRYLRSFIRINGD